ncbi:MAG TPA: hypothetical protein VIS73_13245 [Rhodocyclaceae bacterium]
MESLARALLLSVALAFAGAAAAQGGGDSDAQRRLLEQKLRLVEMLLKSPAAQAREGEAAASVAEGREALARARTALSEARLDEAATLADQALKSVSAASRRGASAPLSESAQRKSLDDLGSQLASYRSSIVELGQDPKLGDAARDLLTRIDSARDESNRLAADGQLGDANRTLAAAYRLAVEEISRLRQGQEVVMSLKFDSPADEYAYDQRRFASNEILVEQMVAQGKADGGRQMLVDKFSADARRIRDEAEGLAAAGDHPGAVVLMEKAVGQLNRALQTMGVPVF